jgi:hypothetical protein
LAHNFWFERGINYVGSLMWCPGIAAIVVALMYRTPLTGLGLGLKKLPYVVLGLCLPLFYSIILHEAVWLTGLGDIEHSISLSLTSF